MTAIVADRRFGVEIECGLPGGCEEAERLLYADPTLRHWVQGDYGREGGFIHEDGSGVEISSPILQGAAGFDELRRVYEILVRNNAYVTTADGMHVHHDAPEFVGQPKNIVRMVETWASNQLLIDTLVHHSRRDNWACIKNWGPQEVEYLKSDGVYRRGRGALNMGALDDHGTIEFRQHEGTLDFNTAQAWIQFGQALMASVLRRQEPLLTCATPKELLYRIRADRMAAAVLLAKETEGEVPTPNERYHEESYCDCDTCYEERYGVEEDIGW